MNGKKNRVLHYSRASGKGKCYPKKCATTNEIIQEDEIIQEEDISTFNSVNTDVLASRITNFKQTTSLRSKLSNIKQQHINKDRLIQSVYSCEQLYLKYCKPNGIYTSKNIIQITQSDFKNGTYRIEEPGYYLIMSDITFDPVELFPTPDNIKYPNGMGKEGVGPYSLGFFAAITIECEDVILDLNYKTIKQSKKHHLQQRFFSVIELAESPFIHKQGPHKFTDKAIKSASRCMIINGTLGRSSHHGIHGNNNLGITICNVDIKDFEVAGIALNGCKDSIITDVTIGPISIPSVISTFSQSIFAAKELQKIVKNDCTETFLGKTPKKVFDTLQDAITKTERAILFNEGSEDPLFISDNIKLGYDGNAYGLVLNVNGVAVNELPSERAETAEGNTNIFLYNIKITEIKTAAKEIVALSNESEIDVSIEAYGTKSQVGIFGAILDITNILNPDHTYKSNALSDALFIIDRCKNRNKISSEVFDWAEGIIKFEDIVKKTQDDETGLYFRLGGDSMSHVMKGTMGIFISCGEGVFGEKITISNVTNFVLETDIDKLTKIAITIETEERPRATLAYDIVQTGCSTIDLQQVVIIDNTPNPKNKNILSTDTEYLKRLHIPHIHENKKLQLQQLPQPEIPKIKNKIINFNSNEHDGDTNTDTNIEYMLV